MTFCKGLILVLALLQGVWFIFDGGRALVVGDYVTPASGPHAGKLGPWAKIISSLGLNPRGNFIKLLHVVLGTAWLVAGSLLAARVSSGWTAVLACAIASLWYLPLGTLIGIMTIALLFILK